MVSRNICHFYCDPVVTGLDPCAGHNSSAYCQIAGMHFRPKQSQRLIFKLCVAGQTAIFIAIFLWGLYPDISRSPIVYASISVFSVLM